MGRIRVNMESFGGAGVSWTSFKAWFTSEPVFDKRYKNKVKTKRNVRALLFCIVSMLYEDEEMSVRPQTSPVMISRSPKMPSKVDISTVKF